MPFEKVYSGQASGAFPVQRRRFLRSSFAGLAAAFAPAREPVPPTDIPRRPVGDAINPDWRASGTHECAAGLAARHIPWAAKRVRAGHQRGWPSHRCGHHGISPGPQSLADFREGKLRSGRYLPLKQAGDETEITLCGLRIRPLFVPGHTVDSVAYMMEFNGRRVAFTGDIGFDAQNNILDRCWGDRDKAKSVVEVSRSKLIP